MKEAWEQAWVQGQIVLGPHTPILSEDLLSELSHQLFQQQGFLQSLCWPVKVKLADQISPQEL